MLAKSFIDNVISNFSGQPLPADFYLLKSRYEIITDTNYQFSQVFNDNDIEIVHWIEDDVYWVIMRSYLKNYLYQSFQHVFFEVIDSVTIINKILNTIPCTLNRITQKFTANCIAELKLEKLLQSTELILAEDIVRYNIITDYEYVPFLWDEKGDIRRFACTVKGNDIVSLCSMEMPTYSTCVRIGVSTKENYRLCGYATSNVIALTKHIFEKGGSVYYSCLTSNVASAKTALAAGLKKAAEVFSLKVTEL